MSGDSYGRIGAMVRVGDVLRGDSLITGHVVVLALMKRLMLLTATVGRERVRPVHVEQHYAPEPQEYIDNPDPEIHTYTIGHAKRSNYGDAFVEWHRGATGRRDPTPFTTCSKADLYRMALALLRRIDESPPPRPEDDWYPDGWREAYDLIKNGKPTAAQQEEHQEHELEEPKNQRGRVLDVLDYVSEKLRADYDEVLAMIGRTRITLAPEDERALLALVKP